MADTFAVRTEGLGRAFEEHYALVGLDAEFPPGSVTALLGPNGAGKSTLIGLLSTLLGPTEGALYFGDVRLSGRAARRARRYVGFVGHRTMLYGALDARENLRFFGRLYGVAGLEARVEAAIERVGLEHAGDRPVQEYSRGMAQRLTLARVLLPEPNVLLLDEPLTGLDPAGVEVALSLVAEQRARGAVVVASHDLAAAGRVADRALILRRGHRRYLGEATGDLSALYAEAVA